jgi:hypothetical protein
MQQNPNASGFLLRKHYLDCVSPTGMVAVAYSANIRWHSISAGASSVTVFDPTREPHSRWSLSDVDVTQTGSELRWDATSLGCHAAMTARSAPVGERLLQTEAGSVEWTCAAPSADVELELGGERHTGLGYCELLTLTIPPWSLPIDRLRWGRFIGGDDSLVWIEWHGAHPLSLAWWNGTRFPGASIDNDRVAIGSEATLVLDRRRPLRSGTLDRLLAPVGALLSMFPVGAFHETKWMSAGRLTTATQVADGWAIHEEVRFR